MATKSTAVFPQTLVSGNAVTTAANVTLTGTPDNTVPLLTAPSDGAEINGLTVLPCATCAATVAYLYASKDTGTTKRLIAAKLVAATTVSTTAAATAVDFGFSDSNLLLLAGNEQLFVGTSVALAAGFSWHAQGRGYTGSV
ncbi:hypothetical protein [Azospirillum doebereinerae]|uniref:Head decoration protein n=1 Tax=Azospirillum doebereinerae TaxID=92933 RepID=A0A3S0XJ03_9PROT|nr:hypothetical protein [Azospirillum doebereinerae]RUQ63978.1 hypothetical protein EJ913_27015 [Azospirillum doebereinerae]